VLEEESPQQKAIRLLNRQLGELQTVRSLNHKCPDFKAWRDTTRGILEMFLGPESHHTARFRDTRFFGPTRIIPYGVYVPGDYVSKEDLHGFRTGCETADATLRAAIRYVEDFGVYVEQPKPVTARRGGGRASGMSQNFHGPVNLNQAIATGSAIQRIGHVGNKTGTDLKEMLYLLQQSQDLTPRQLKEGAADIEALAAEVEKPEDERNWRSVLECGQRVLELAGKAVDLGAKLGLHLPAVAGLVDKAKHCLK